MIKLEKMHPAALVFGGSGLIGSHLLNELIHDSYYEVIHVVVRRSIRLDHPRCQVYCIDFDQLEDYRDLFKVTDVYCCLGTTLKQAGTVEKFHRVDYEYPAIIARLAQQCGVKQLAVVSSVGSNENSKNYYLATKGKLEAYLKSLDSMKIYIFKPSMLLGKRKQFRFGELIGKVIFPLLSPFLIRSLTRWKAIFAGDVARAMFGCLKESGDSKNLYYNEMTVFSNRK